MRNLSMQPSVVNCAANIRHYMSKDQKMLWGDVVLPPSLFKMFPVGIDAEPWRAIRRYPLKSCKYVVMATCLHFPNQRKLLGTMPVAMHLSDAHISRSMQLLSDFEEEGSKHPKQLRKKQGRSLRSQVCPSSQNGGPHRHQYVVMLLYLQRWTLSEQFPS